MLLSCEGEEQRSASHRLLTPTCGSHLVPEDVPGDGGRDLHNDHQRQQDGKLGSGGGEKALKTQKPARFCLQTKSGSTVVIMQ